MDRRHALPAPAPPRAHRPCRAVLGPVGNRQAAQVLPADPYRRGAARPPAPPMAGGGSSNEGHLAHGRRPGSTTNLTDLERSDTVTNKAILEERTGRGGQHRRSGE